MGGCPSHCEVRCGNGMRYEGSVMELNLEHYEKENERKQSASSSRHAESMTLPNTKFKKENDYDDTILHTHSDPKNELIQSNIEMEFLPIFVTAKHIHDSTVLPRQNRFIQDLEIEVKSRIQEIYQKEQEEKQIYLIKQLVQQQLEQERKRQYESNQTQPIQEHNSQEPIYKHYSTQVSPNKNASNNSKDSQFASQPSSSRQMSSDKQSNNQLSMNRTDPQKYHKDDQMQSRALEKLASNFLIEDGSCSSSKKKGILKQQQHQKYAHTSKSLPNKKQFFQSKTKKMKRVHFSHDTNFNFEKKSDGSKPKSWWKSIF